MTHATTASVPDTNITAQAINVAYWMVTTSLAQLCKLVDQLLLSSLREGPLKKRWGGGGDFKTQEIFSAHCLYMNFFSGETLCAIFFFGG